MKKHKHRDELDDIIESSLKDTIKDIKDTEDPDTWFWVCSLILLGVLVILAGTLVFHFL